MSSDLPSVRIFLTGASREPRGNCVTPALAWQRRGRRRGARGRQKGHPTDQGLRFTPGENVLPFRGESDLGPMERLLAAVLAHHPTNVPLSHRGPTYTSSENQPERRTNVRTILDRSILASLIVGLLFASACAKRPVATASQAPAPAPAPAPPPPVAAAPTPPPPAPRPAPPKEYRPDDALKPINFAFDSATVRPADTKVLDASAAWLAKNDGYLLLIEGHCDERGTEAYNLALGDRRAKSAMNYLVAQGVKGDRVTIVSFGEERPVCTEHNEACWSKNRRDMFLIKER